MPYDGSHIHQHRTSNPFSAQLVIDKSLASLPKLTTDGAIIIRSQDAETTKARVCKLNVVAKDPVLIERYAKMSPCQHCPEHSL